MEKLKCKIGKGTIEVMGVKVNTFVDLEFVRATDNKVAFMSKKGEMIITSMQLFKRWTNNIVVAQQFIDRGVWDIVPDEDVIASKIFGAKSLKEEIFWEDKSGNDLHLSQSDKNKTPQYEAPDLSKISIDENGNMTEVNSQSFPESEQDEKIGKLSNLDLRHALMNILFFFLIVFVLINQIANYDSLQVYQFIIIGVALILGNIYFIKQKRKLRK